MRFTFLLAGLLAVAIAHFLYGEAAIAQTSADKFAVPGCMDTVNNDYYACQKRARAMAAAGVEKSDAASMAEAWRIVCTFKDRESCEEAARIYTQGGPGLVPDLRIAANFHARACEFGADSSCEAALDWFSRPGGNTRDIKRLAFLYNDRCTRGSPRACENGAFIVANGFGDRFSGLTNLTLARSMAETGCKSGQSANSCLLAEMLYGDASLEGADAARSLTYAERNCTAGEGASCLRLGADAQRSNDWGKAADRYADACRLGVQAGCGRAADAQKMKAYLAQQQEAKSGFLGALESGDYAAATHAAIYVYKSKDHLAEAIRFIAGKGRMGSVPTNHLYVTALWFPSGDVFEAANREMRNRGTGLEGRFGGDTNAPGMAAARWQSAYSRGSSAYRASSGSSFTPSPMPSAAEIANQTRQRYHHVNCVMSKIPNNPNC